MTDKQVTDLINRVKVAIDSFTSENGVRALMTFTFERKIEGLPEPVSVAVGYTNMPNEEIDLVIARLEEIKAYQEHIDPRPKYQINLN
jgi:hypothetical protein